MAPAGFAPSNWEFQQLTVACAEAALRSGGAAERARAVALAGALPGEAIDLHGLSATEARVAVLCLLSSLQVNIESFIGCRAQDPTGSVI